MPCRFDGAVDGAAGFLTWQTPLSNVVLHGAFRENALAVSIRGMAERVMIVLTRREMPGTLMGNECVPYFDEGP